MVDSQCRKKRHDPAVGGFAMLSVKSSSSSLNLQRAPRRRIAD